jgi:ribonuclease E
MAKRMLIDATHPEETRVVVLNGNKLEEFDFETSTKKQLKGNIYLAKVTRVEPSLQAAFVDYGGNRHGFLAFNEIHPDYWRIPVADREALLAEHNAADDDDEPRRHRRRGRERFVPPESDGPPAAEGETAAAQDDAPAGFTEGGVPPADLHAETPPADGESLAQERQREAELEPEPEQQRSAALDHDVGLSVSASPEQAQPHETPEFEGEPRPFDASSEAPFASDAPMAPAETGEAQPGEAPVPAERTNGEGTSVESIGGDDVEEEVETRRRYRPMRHYKIQEVIKRRQVLLVQVVKEERGTKGAALTTYLSLAGRYCVLMPNTARGGGISRRITSAQDRKRLKSIMEDLDLPEGTAVILRTAGMERSKPEIKRDYEYLQRQWDDIRELTLKSTAPCLVYEEGNLIKRAIRDLYARDIDDILVEGDEGYRTAKAFMKTLMPSHTARIQLYNEPTVPLFQRFQVESQLDEMHGPTVRLRSGGYIVINPTEALVSIDVNSGRATRERHIEETAYKTNLEAADEIARQLRLRDLAGLIVIDFIDMEDNRNQHAVERRLKEAMKSDRARIQIGRISPFGLLELSRQRLRPSLQEVSSERCPHCGGSGMVRSTESTALHVLRAIEEEGMKMRTIEATVHLPTSIAIYILNQKRETLINIEARYGLRVAFSRDDTLIPPAYRLDRTRARTPADPLPAQPVVPPPMIEADEPTPAMDGGAELDATPAEAEGEPAFAGESEPRESHGEGDGENGHRGRRRRRRRGRGRGREDERGHPQHDRAAGEGAPVPVREFADDQPQGEGADHVQPPAEGGDMQDQPGEPRHGRGQPGHEQGQQGQGDGEDGGRRRRRGRRGGRRRGRRGFEPEQPGQEAQDPFTDPRQPPMAAEAERPAHDDGPPPPPPPRRIEGPGDAYDWPWNRRAERFPDEVASEQEATRAANERGHEPEPEPDAPRPQPEPPPREPALAAQPAEPSAPAAEAPAEPDTPSGPPRRGWWRRLTS